MVSEIGCQRPRTTSVGVIGQRPEPSSKTHVGEFVGNLATGLASALEGVLVGTLVNALEAVLVGTLVGSHVDKLVDHLVKELVRALEGVRAKHSSMPSKAYTSERPSVAHVGELVGNVVRGLVIHSRAYSSERSTM